MLTGITAAFPVGFRRKLPDRMTQFISARKRQMSYYRQFWACVFVMLVPAASGCGSNSPFTSVPVHGKVTYDDGTLVPVAGIRIFFHSLEPPKNGMHPRPAQAAVGPDGTFKDVTSYKFADGLVLGKHRVSLVCEEGGKLTSKIPRDYALPEKTPLEIEVTESDQFLEIKIPKPKQ